MTRADIERDYTVADGRITSPGKFEGEQVFAPYFWDVYLNGLADGDDGEVLTFEVDDTDRGLFPELENAVEVQLNEDSNGFVYCWVSKFKGGE